MAFKRNEIINELMFDKSTHFKQVCQLLLSLIVALWGKINCLRDTCTTLF